MSKATTQQPREENVQPKPEEAIVVNSTSISSSREMYADESSDAIEGNKPFSHTEANRMSLSLSRAQTTATEEVVELDDAKVVQFSESPAASAARASLARFAQAAKAQRQRLALVAATSPPTSPDQAATRARDVYLKHLAAEITHGPNYAAAAAAAAASTLPRDEVSRLLAEVGLEQHYTALISECCGGDATLAVLARLGESRLHATLEALGVPRVRARKLWKRLESQMAAKSPSLEANDDGTSTMESLALPNALSPTRQPPGELSASSSERPQHLAFASKLPDKVITGDAQITSIAATTSFSVSPKAVVINASAARRSSFRGRQQTMREKLGATESHAECDAVAKVLDEIEQSEVSKSSSTYVNNSSNAFIREPFALTTSTVNSQGSNDSNGSTLSTYEVKTEGTLPIESKECSSEDSSVPCIEKPTGMSMRDFKTAGSVNLGDTSLPSEMLSSKGSSATSSSVTILTAAQIANSLSTSVAVSPPGSLRTSTSRQLTNNSAACVSGSNSRVNNENNKNNNFGNSSNSSNSSNSRSIVRSIVRSNSPRSPAGTAMSSTGSPRSSRPGVNSTSSTRSRSRSPRASMGKSDSPGLRPGRGACSPRASARRVGTAATPGVAGPPTTPSAINEPLNISKRNRPGGVAHGKLHTPSVSAHELSGLLARVADRPRMRSIDESGGGSFRESAASPPAFSSTAASSSPTAAAMAAATAWMAAAKAVVVAQQSTPSKYQGSPASNSSMLSPVSTVHPSSANHKACKWHPSSSSSTEVEGATTSSLNLEAPSSEGAFERAANNAAGSTEI